MEALSRKNTFITTYRQNGDSGPIYVSMKVSRMEDDERFIIVGITNVDAEMRDAMAKSEALAEALTAAEDANKAKISFLSSMSHEIRTPMNAIIGLDALALRDETLSEQAHDYLRKIGDSAKHLLSLINNILSNAIKFTEAPGSITMTVEPGHLYQALGELIYEAENPK